jgi:hypothetical protein
VGTSARVSVTLMLCATRLPAKPHVEVQMVHGNVVVLQPLCAGMEAVSHSAALTTVVKVKHAKSHVMA